MMFLLKIMLKLFLFHVLTIIHRELHLYLSGRAHTYSGLPVNQCSMGSPLGWSDELAVVLEKDMHSSLSGWHILQVHVLIWFTNMHFSFFYWSSLPGHLQNVTFAVCIFNPLFFPPCWFLPVLKQCLFNVLLWNHLRDLVLWCLLRHTHQFLCK